MMVVSRWKLLAVVAWNELLVVAEQGAGAMVRFHLAAGMLVDYLIAVVMLDWNSAVASTY